MLIIVDYHIDLLHIESYYFNLTLNQYIFHITSRYLEKFCFFIAFLIVEYTHYFRICFSFYEKSWIAVDLALDSLNLIDIALNFFTLKEASESMTLKKNA